MKRKYEVAYYEYGLTSRKTRRFFFEISAYMFRAWLEYQYKEMVCAEIKEIENDK